MSRKLMHSLEETLETAVLVVVNSDEAEDQLVEDELVGLCEAAGVEPLTIVRQRLDRPNKATFLGSGKVEEVALIAKDVDSDIVLIDGEVSGIQQRNLEETIGRRVVDRTQLILDIFARRAKTKEGMLQVELAQLTYMLPKLMSVYTKFERQKGGIGMRGPGETKLESDRRLARDRIAKLKREIDEVRKIRGRQRESRRKHPFPFATLVGYTSAGKSTLMNKLAATDLLADSMPFATLDPTTRKVELSEGHAFFLTDTVGFIRNLPTDLVAAFRSTLEEVTMSDFVLLLIDFSDAAWMTHLDTVRSTLQMLKADDKPTILVFNKVDLVENSVERNRIVAEWPNAVAISSITGEGLTDLTNAIERQVDKVLGNIKILIPYSHSAILQECYQFGRVTTEEYRENGIYVEAQLVAEMRSRVASYVVA